MTAEPNDTPPVPEDLEPLTVFAPMHVLVRFSVFVEGPMDWKGLVNLMDCADMHYADMWKKIRGQ